MSTLIEQNKEMTSYKLQTGFTTLLQSQGKWTADFIQYQRHVESDETEELPIKYDKTRSVHQKGSHLTTQSETSRC